MRHRFDAASLVDGSVGERSKTVTRCLMSLTPTSLAAPFASVTTSRRLLEGVGDMNPDWMRLNILGDAIAARLAGTGVRAPLAELTPTLSAALEAVRLGVDAQHLAALVERLR